MAATVRYIGLGVDTTASGSGSTYTWTYANAIPAGAFMYAYFFTTTAKQINSFTDSSGAEWTSNYLGTETLTSSRHHVFWAVAPRSVTTTDTLAINCSNITGTCGLTIMAFSGVRPDADTSFSAGQGTNASGSSTSVSVSTANPTRGAAILFGRMYESGTAGYTAATNTVGGTWQKPGSTWSGGTAVFACEYKIVESTAQNTYNPTIAGAVPWNAWIMGFLEDVVAPEQRLLRPPGRGHPRGLVLRHRDWDTDSYVAPTYLPIDPAGPIVDVTPGIPSIDLSIAVDWPTVTITPGTATVAPDQSLAPDGATVTVTAGTAAVGWGIPVEGPTVTVTPGTPALAQNITPNGPTVTMTPGTATVSVVQDIAPVGPTVTVTAGVGIVGQGVAITGPTVTMTPGTPALALSVAPAGPTVTITPGTPGIAQSVTPAGPTVIVTPGTPGVLLPPFKRQVIMVVTT